MSKENGKTTAMKWTVLVVSSAIFAISTIYRLFKGEEADSGLCWVFISVGGFIFGAKVIEYFKK